MPIRLSEDEFAALVDQAVADLPAEFRSRLDNVTIDVQPRPSEELLRSAPVSPQAHRSLLGLYQGVPLTRKSVRATFDWPERIFIFQRNVEAACRTRRQVVQQVRRVILHEIGHHLGMSERDLEDYGFG